MFDIRLYCLLVIIVGVAFLSPAQDNYSTPSRTPEQEAAFLTEKMKKDLQLSPEQSQAIYEINLRYARERKVETSRIKALERVRMKEAEIQQVLTNDQISRMQERRINRNPSVSPPTYYRADRMPTTRPQSPASSGNQPTATTQVNPGSQPRAASPPASGSQPRAVPPASSGNQSGGNRSSSGPERTSGAGSGGSRR